jgi:hypothetical protein
MSDDITSALSVLGLEDSAMMPIVDRLAEEAFDIAALIQAMRVFTLAAEPDRLENVPGQSIEIRRSHLTALVALIDDVRAHLAAIFRSIDLDTRLPDADMLDPVHDGLNTAGEALTEIVRALHQPYQY